MTNKNTFKVLEFKSQKEINDENTRKIEKERQALRREVESIWNRGNNNHRTRNKSLI
ncbi:hypothetical protein [Gracilibacillus sp. YIM 98692]|uniref:hypothetical protein n=1 Tax=Gracilibacillus sp. YIM 98692 TaxID=2663532 RepID=UPI0013D0EED4|nr:hypothetical protein [Gracilibacillus sp. YIM 98692]